MNVRLLLSVATTLLTFTCAAQSRSMLDVTLSSEYDDYHNLILNADHNGYGTRTIFIDYSDTRNCNIPPRHYFIIKHSGPFLTVKPIDKKTWPALNYKYWVIEGTLNPTNVDSLFVYRLPFSKNKTAIARSLYNTDERKYGESNTINWKSFQFILEKGDTVYAARKGIVIKVYDGDSNLYNDDSSVYNFVKIEHLDGTVAMYSIFQRNSILVHEGDIVYPGTPLALAGNYYGKKFETRLKIYYKTYKQTEHRRYSEQLSASHFIDPYFATTQGNIRLIKNSYYTPSEPTEVITKEMSKREIKKYFRK